MSSLSRHGVRHYDIRNVSERSTLQHWNTLKIVSVLGLLFCAAVHISRIRERIDDCITLDRDSEPEMPGARVLRTNTDCELVVADRLGVHP